VLTWGRQHEVALGALDRALRLNPSYAHWQVAADLMFAGDVDRAVASMKAYMQLDPYFSTSAIGWLGVAYCTLGRLTEALALLREAVARSPKRAMFQYWLAAAYTWGMWKRRRNRLGRSSRCSLPLRSKAPPDPSQFSGSRRMPTISLTACGGRGSPRECPHSLGIGAHSQTETWVFSRAVNWAYRQAT
jgi:tetratricopeptide (TPR) repeat protein